MLRPTVSRPVCFSFGSKFLLMLESCGFVHMERPLWQKEGSVVQNFCWSSPAQSFSGMIPAKLMTVFYCLKFETPLTWRTRSQYLYPIGTEWSSHKPRRAEILQRLTLVIKHLLGSIIKHYLATDHLFLRHADHAENMLLRYDQQASAQQGLVTSSHVYLSFSSHGSLHNSQIVPWANMFISVSLRIPRVIILWKL
jgi:hypothetical protein